MHTEEVSRIVVAAGKESGLSWREVTAWERAEERSFFGEVVGVAVVLPGGGGVVWGLGGEVLGVAEGGREVEGEEGEEEGVGVV